MVIGVVSVSLSIPEAHSLKDKRQVIKSLKDRTRNALNVSVAEVGRQDAWQFAEMAFAAVAADEPSLHARLDELDRSLHADPRYVILNVHTDILGGDDPDDPQRA